MTVLFATNNGITMWTLINVLFGPILGILGTAAVVLAALARYREKRQADMIEVAQTWRDTADARALKIEALEALVKTLRTNTAKLDFRIEFLWGAVETTQRSNILKQMSKAEAEHCFFTLDSDD